MKVPADGSTAINGVEHPTFAGKPVTCPLGTAGDSLWVRERWAYASQWNDRATKPTDEILYAADHDPVPYSPAWRGSLHMPRTASRLTLSITSARAERLTAITEDDARAEGFDPATQLFDARLWFSQLWDGLVGETGPRFAADPWVWVITFQPHLTKPTTARRDESGPPGFR